MKDSQLLAQVPFFTSLDLQYLEALAGKLIPRSYRKGATIFHKGDPGSTLFIIKSGQVNITTASRDGTEVLLAVLKNGDSFGEVALLDEQPRSASAAAIEPTRALTLHRKDLIELIHNQPSVAIDILVEVSKRWRRTTLLLEDAVFLDVSSRLAKRLLELAETDGSQVTAEIDIQLRITQQELADTVGATREAVNKLLKLFQHQGLVSVSNRRITILRPHDLRDLVD